MRAMLRPLFPACYLLALLVLRPDVAPAASTGDAYSTGFETFTTGNDTIIGTDSWTGTYAGWKLHGVMSETEHKVVGLGNAAFIGGFATTVTGTSKSVYVHRPVSLDPLALGQEVATFSVVFGIKDSTTSKRDNFEFRIYNQSGSLLAGIQFDNSTLDTSNLPRRLSNSHASRNGSPGMVGGSPATTAAPAAASRRRPHLGTRGRLRLGAFRRRYQCAPGHQGL